MIIVLLNTGMRRHELFNLMFKDIDYARKTITVRSDKTSDYRLFPIKKELYENLYHLTEY